MFEEGSVNSVLRNLQNQKENPSCDESSFLLLGYPDSNQERQDQNLQCYHYTIAQSIC